MKELDICNSSGNKTVLVVDDNEFNRELVRDILEDEDIIVYEADDGMKAVEIIRSDIHKKIDVVLMDIRMPVMDGIEATCLIRKGDGLNANVPIIAMTANTFETDCKELLSKGMNGVIVKPVDVNTLADQIAKLAGW